MKRSELIQILDSKSKDMNNYYMRNHTVVDNKDHNWTSDELVRNYRLRKLGKGIINDYAYIIYCDNSHHDNLLVIEDYEEDNEDISDYIYKWISELEKVNNR